jgi:hypothetical protein
MMHRRTGRRLAALAAAAVVVAQGAALAQAPSGPSQLTKPIHVTKEDLNPGRTYSSPNLAVNPSNPKVIVGAFAELRTRRCGLIRSTDAGQTWKVLDTTPSPSSYPSCNANPRGTFQGHVEFGKDGALYYALNGWDTQDGGVGGNVSIIVSKSTDLGDHWEPVVARDARGRADQDREANRPVTGFAVDASGDRDVLYVGASRRQPGFTGANALPNQPIVAVSTDGGRTFGQPINLAEVAFSDAAMRQNAFKSTTTTAPNPATTTTTAPPGSRAAVQDQASNFGGFGPALAVDDKGTVYAAWPSTYANLNPRPSGGILLSKSTDKGKTWQTSQLAPFSPNTGSFVYLAWSPKGGSEGTLVAVANGYEQPATGGLEDIYVYRSTDGGKTWSEKKNVTDDDPRQVFTQVYANVDIAPNGRIDVTFFDTRDDPGTRANDVYYTYSEDNGVTWSKNMRISDQSIDRNIGVWANNADVNAPPGLASTNEYALIAWDDTRNGDAVGQAQDIYAAHAQFAAVGGGGASKTAKIIAAGVVGLLGVGLILLAVAFLARGRSGDGTPRKAAKAEKAAEKKPAKV